MSKEKPLYSESKKAIFDIFLNQIGELAKKENIKPKAIISYSWDNPGGYQFYTIDEFKKNTPMSLIPVLAEKAVILTNIKDETDSNYKVYIKMGNKIEEREIKIKDRGSIPPGTGELTAHVGEEVYKLIKRVADVKDEDLPHNRRITLFREMLYQANVQAEIDCYDATTVGPYVEKFESYPDSIILAATPLLKLKCDKEKLANDEYPHWVAKEASLILNRLERTPDHTWFVPVIFSQEGKQLPFPKKFEEYQDQSLKFIQDDYYKEFLEILKRVFDGSGSNHKDIERIKKRIECRIECMNEKKYPALFTPMGLVALSKKLLSPEQIIELGNAKLEILLQNVGLGAMLLKLITAEQAKELDESALKKLLTDGCDIAAILLKVKEENGRKLSSLELKELTENSKRPKRISLFDGVRISIPEHAKKPHQIFSKEPIEKFKNHFFNTFIDLIGESARKNRVSPRIIVRGSSKDEKRIELFVEKLIRTNIDVIITCDDKNLKRTFKEKTEHSPTVILAATPSLKEELKDVEFISELLKEADSSERFIPVIFSQEGDKAPFPNTLKEKNVTEVLKYLDDNNDEIFLNILRRIYKRHCDIVSKDIENSIIWMKNFHSISSSSSHGSFSSAISSKFGFYSLSQFLTDNGIQALRKGFTPELAKELGVGMVEALLSERGLSAMLLGLITAEQVIKLGEWKTEILLTDHGITAMLLGKISIDQILKFGLSPLPLQFLLTGNGFDLLMTGEITPEQIANFNTSNLEVLLTDNAIIALKNGWIKAEEVLKMQSKHPIAFFLSLRSLLNKTGLELLRKEKIDLNRAMQFDFGILGILMTDKGKVIIEEELMTPQQTKSIGIDRSQWREILTDAGLAKLRQQKQNSNSLSTSRYTLCGESQRQSEQAPLVHNSIIQNTG